MALLRVSGCHAQLSVTTFEFQTKDWKNTRQSRKMNGQMASDQGLVCVCVFVFVVAQFSTLASVWIENGLLTSSLLRLIQDSRPPPSRKNVQFSSRRCSDCRFGDGAVERGGRFGLPNRSCAIGRLISCSKTNDTKHSNPSPSMYQWMR